MKQIYSLTLFLFCTNAIAQTTDVITNITNPTALTLVNNDLYFGLWTGGLNKIDITDTSPSPQDIASSTGIYRSFLYNNILYYSERVNDKISKIDITQTSPSPADVITNVDDVRGIAIKNNILYFSEFTSNQVCKIDLTNTNPTKTIISNQFVGPTGLTIINNDLYVAEWGGNKISKIDITQTNPSPVDVVTNLNNPTEVISNGNNLIVAEFSANKVLTIDVSDINAPVVSDLITNLNNPAGLFLDDIDLYISVFGDNKIVKFSSTVLSIEENNSDSQKITIFPNPSLDFIQILGLKVKENYRIYDTLGKEIKKGTISNQENIDIHNFTNGLYFLKFKNGNTLKFLKD